MRTNSADLNSSSSQFLDLLYMQLWYITFPLLCFLIFHVRKSKSSVFQIFWRTFCIPRSKIVCAIIKFNLFSSFIPGITSCTLTRQATKSILCHNLIRRIQSLLGTADWWDTSWVYKRYYERSSLIIILVSCISRASKTRVWDEKKTICRFGGGMPLSSLFE